MKKLLFILVFFSFTPFAFADPIVLYESYETGGVIEEDYTSGHNLIGTFTPETDLLFDVVGGVHLGLQLQVDVCVGGFTFAVASTTNATESSFIYAGSHVYPSSDQEFFDITNIGNGSPVWMIAGHTYGIYALSNCTFANVVHIVADSSNLIYYGYLSWDGEYFDTFLDIAGRTRIISVTPANASTTASSTPFTVGTSIYVDDDDFEDGMRVRQKITQTNKPATVASIVFPVLGIPLPSFIQALFTDEGLEYEITHDESSNFSTTTSIVTTGLHTLYTYIEKPRLLSSLFGYSEVVKSKTYFIVGTTTLSDNILLGIGENLGDLVNSGESYVDQLAHCNPLSSFDMGICIRGLFFLSDGAGSELLDGLREDILTKFPLGYVTRLISIIGSTATSSIPTASFEVKGSSAFSGVYYVDIASELQQADDLMDSFTSADGYIVTSEPLGFWDIVMPWLTLLGYLGLLSLILRDILGLSFHQGTGQIGRHTGGVTNDEYKYKEKLYNMSKRK